MAKENYTLGSVTMRTGGGRGGRILEKPHDFKKAWKEILHYAGAYKVQIVVIFILAVGAVLFSLFGPNQLKTITNLIVDGMEQSGAAVPQSGNAASSGNGIDLARILRISIFAVSLYFISSALMYVQNYLTTMTATGINHDLRRDISRKINFIPLSRLDSSSFGDVLSRVTNDIDTIGESLSHSAVQMIRGLVTFLFASIAMLITNVPLALTALASSMLGFLFMKVIITKSQKYFVARQRYLGEMNGHIEEMYAGHVIVKAYNGEQDSLERFEEINQNLYYNNYMSQFLSGMMMPFMELVSNLGYLLVCVVGAIMTSKGLISFGTIIAFIIYVKIFTQPLGMVSQAVTALQSAAAAAERVFAFLAEPEMPDESDKLQDFVAEKGEVSFDHIHFGYTPERTIINDFSFIAKPGMKVAIVGPTGAGKTTLVNLLMRFYELNSGEILIDGTKTTDLSKANVRKLFAMVLQDTWLFEGSIRDNIAYGSPDVTDEEIKEACRKVGLHRYIRSLKDGYDTVINDAFSLSAGQRQLMTIARAMVSKKPLLILDEATSSVDTRTEQLVQNAMEELTRGRTSFTIAHRLSTIRNADIILVMRDGDIVEQGTHDALLAANGFYAELWNSQFLNAVSI